MKPSVVDSKCLRLMYVLYRYLELGVSKHERSHLGVLISMRDVARCP